MENKEILELPYVVLRDHILLPRSGFNIAPLSRKGINTLYLSCERKFVICFYDTTGNNLQNIGLLCRADGFLPIKDDLEDELLPPTAPKSTPLPEEIQLFFTGIARVQVVAFDDTEKQRGNYAKNASVIRRGKFKILENDFNGCDAKAIGELLESLVDEINKIGQEQIRFHIAQLVFKNFLPSGSDKPEIMQYIVPIVSDILRGRSGQLLTLENIINSLANDLPFFANWLDWYLNSAPFELHQYQYMALAEPKVIKRMEIFVTEIFPIVIRILENEAIEIMSRPQNKRRQIAGPGGENADEISEIQKKIDKSKMPDEARKEAENALTRLKRILPSSAEYEVHRNYLDWLLNIPWGIYTEDKLDLGHIKKTLDEDHFGLNQVKERVLEYMAVRKLNPNHKAPILCFVGPPGTGKTSIANSISRALGRKKISISLGSVRDEAEIKGHRITYIGAIPGCVIKGLRKAGTQNPVFILDEIDKLRQDFRGDPAAALLEVLDPEQNHAFRDHYLDVGVDLSKIMFITTANTLDTIPPPLLDRMEVIEFSTYLDHEKLEIAKKFLIAKQIKDKGLDKYGIGFTDEAVMKIIRNYTREAGVRNLERAINTVCRKIAAKVADNKFQADRDGIIDSDKINAYLGIPRFSTTELLNKMEPGVANGLAWTPYGGTILHIEATETTDFDEKYKITGSIGDVMKESAHVIITFIQSNLKILKIDKRHFSNNKGIHFHIPEGAVKKDGPSAGLAMAITAISEYTKKSLIREVAFTGELSSKGRILAVGGIREKTLAAKRAGIKTIFLPASNKKDIEELENYIKDGITFIYVSNIKDVLLTHSGEIFENTPKSGDK